MDPQLRELLADFDPRDAARLRKLVERLVANPPDDSQDVALAFRPLFQRNYDAGSVFPDLLVALANTNLAAAVLDLANYLTRHQRVKVHPAAGRVEQLISLLGSLTHELERLVKQPLASGDEAQAKSAMVTQSVSLGVALCDALALIGDRAAVGKLYQTLDLAHRRLRTEAAAALARLGEEVGQEALLQLAAEPVARLRVLAYAQELGFLDKVDPQYCSVQAKAEAELVLWLAEPTQFGLPPGECELVDSRTQYWPGYDEAIECFLFRYAYPWGDSGWSNVGIAGPLAHSFLADLADLPLDDIYAAYAGWQAEHEEIGQWEVDSLLERELPEVARLVRRLCDAGFASITPLTLASFFGDKVLIASAARDGVEGLAVADALETWWRPRGAAKRPLGPVEMYCIYKGRRLLRTFNQNDQ